MNQRLLLILLICFSFSFKNSDEAAIHYINEYRDLAIVEMYRTGVPASIKLAQGLLESNSGTSDLAIKANNHFGIKCKSYWTGESYYHKDDDRDQTGRIIDSCFRAYRDVVDSYVDHSNFLKNSPHYSSLFDYSLTDYHSWARGLKASGYATDPIYAEKLIRKIEEFNLSQYDSWTNPLQAISSKATIVKD